MNPLALVGGWFGGLPKWARDLLILLGLFAGFLIFGKAWLEAHDFQVRKRQQDKADKLAAEEAARIAEARRKLEETRSHDVREAERAGAGHVVSGTVDELRARDPDLAAIVYGPARGGGGETEGR